MNTIVDELRAVAATHTQHFGIMREAAARIEALEAALREIADLRYSNTSAATIAQTVLARARAALDKDVDE